MEIIEFAPKNQILKEYIECFYILRRNGSEKKESYITFPSNNSILSILLGSSLNITENKCEVFKSDRNSIISILTVSMEHPILFKYNGLVNELTIHFKPLGINQFLANSIDSYNTGTFFDFYPFSDYELKIKEIMGLEDLELIDKMEEYLMSKIVGFHHPFLQEAVRKINIEPNIPLQNLSNDLGVSSKTLIKHLCKTPSSYKRILRFRNSAQSNINNDNNLILFFDQAHMIKEFKKNTCYTPKNFFNKLSSPESSRLKWISV